ncbi:MAG: class I SAM-dependent methyltransferase [Pseudomonadota bacterium]
MTNQAEFWTKTAKSYRRSPISDLNAYHQTLERVRSYLPADARVLELGCGTGGTAVELAQSVEKYVASDYSAGMIDEALVREIPDNVSFEVADVFDSTFKSGSFDAVLAFNLFHLVEKRAEQFARVHELLVPGGMFISKSVCLKEPGLGLKFGILKRLIPLMQRLGKAPAVAYLSMLQLEDEISAAGFRIVETGNYPAKPPNHFVVAKRV